MKQDLEHLMVDRDIDVAIVTGGVHNNPCMYYMANGAHISTGILVKHREQAPVLIYAEIERDEATKSGLATMSRADFDYKGLVLDSESMLEADIRFYQRIFERLDVRGQVAFYGMADRGASYALLMSLESLLEDITIVGEYDGNIFTTARATKGADEIARLQRVGQATSMAMREIMDVVRAHQVARRKHQGSPVEMLVKADGTPLTVGDVKRYASERLFAYDLEEAQDMVFAIGRDAGVPHSRGEAKDPLCLGKSIVFDFFPREKGGGYYHDMTRTFCLGYAPPEVQAVYDDVLDCFRRVTEVITSGLPTRRCEELACDIFEAHGHNTHRRDRTKQEGYVHSLGHGVGLDIHERPGFGLLPANQDVFGPGVVITVEPGLYYPERGFGVRIEDTICLDHEGRFQSLTDFEKQLVLEM